MTTPEALRALERDLEELKELTEAEGFNLFHALGITTRELSYSNFIEYLLNSFPRLRRRLLDWAFDATTIIDPEKIDVARERHSIDLLLLGKNGKGCIVIENKIDAGEGDQQLARYRQIVDETYPDHHPKVGIFLTPDGRAPTSDIQERSPDDWLYKPLSYSQFAKWIRAEVIDVNVAADVPQNAEVLVAQHVVDSIERFIVSDSEVARKARQIYEEHRQAIETVLLHTDPHESVLGVVKKVLAAEGIQTTADRNNGLNAVVEGASGAPVQVDIRSYENGRRLTMKRKDDGRSESHPVNSDDVESWFRGVWSQFKKKTLEGALISPSKSQVVEPDG